MVRQEAAGERLRPSQAARSASCDLRDPPAPWRVWRGCNAGQASCDGIDVRDEEEPWS